MQQRLPAALEGRWIRLRPISKSDHPQIFSHRIQFGSLHLNGVSVSVPTFDDWEATELRQMLSSGPAFVIESRDGIFCGITRLHKLNLHDGWAYLDTRVRLDQDDFVVLETFVTVLDYAFTWKVYVETLALHGPLVERLARLDFDEEVRLKDYVWHDGSYVDLLHFSMYRTRWQDIRERFVASLDVAHAADVPK